MTKGIVHLKNQYLPWNEFKSGQITYWFKGNIFYKNKLLNNSETVNLLISIVPFEEILTKVLNELNGEYAIVIETPETVVAIVDRIRSIPLFYAMNGIGVVFSDDANYLRESLNSSFNEENGAELLVTGFVTGSETLFNGISQLQAGDYLRYGKTDGSLTTSHYHRFWHGNYFLDSEEELMNRLDETFVHVFQRLIESTKGLQIVVPLSGGLDSRIIVSMLKRLGVDDVICFTYGKKGDKEAEISRQVAEALGYEWHFVEYTKEKLYKCYHSEIMESYHAFSGNLIVLPHIQDFIAINELKENGKIPENSVFVPGHSGDMLAGSHIPLDYVQPQTYTFEKFLEDSLNKHHTLWKWEDEKLESLFKQRIRKSVGDISIHDNESCANAMELFDFNERQAKYIVNSVRAYEFFNYGWRLPLWDSELINFYLRVPLKYRIAQELYIKYVNKCLFGDNFKFLRNIECTTSIVEKENSPNKILRYMSLINNTTKNFSDIRWYRYFKFPLLSRLYLVRKYDLRNINKFKSIKIWSQNIHQIFVSLGGYQSMTYLIQTIKKANND